MEAIWLRVPRLDQSIEWGEDALIVRIHTDAGIVGLGETDSSPAVVKAVIETPASHRTCVGLRDILLGENPLDIDRLWKKMYSGSSYMGSRGAVIHAISAIDIALWDIAGKYYNVPVYQLLGGKYRDEIPAYASFVAADHIDENRRIVNSVLDTGVRTIKLGGGSFGMDPAADKRLLEAVRNQIGPDIQLAIDLVYRWKNHRYARQQAAALEEFDLAWIEEPIPADDHLGLKQLAETISTTISGGEILSARAEFEEFIVKTKPGIVQPDITRCGGISEIRRIHDTTNKHGVQLVPHGFSTGILLAATVHYLVSTPDGEMIEYSHNPSPLFMDLVRNKPPLVDGVVKSSDRPGLGIELDEDLIEKYRVGVTFRAREDFRHAPVGASLRHRL